MNSTSRRITWFRWVSVAAAVLLVAASMLVWWWRQPPKSLFAATTLAGAGAQIAADALSDPFGVAIDDDGNIFVSDGRGGRIYRFATAQGSASDVTTVAQQLDMPSALAIDRDGTLVVANTGAHTIVRVDPKNGSIAIIAGVAGVSGFADGSVREAKFNAPVGVAVSGDGTIFVADTYNDRIRAITKDGQVKTLAGGNEPWHRDGTSAEARFDTPCGIAVAADGSLFVADTGNHRIRRVTMEGVVSTIAGTGEDDERDGEPHTSAFAEPIAIALRDANSFYVADAGGNTIRLCELGNKDNPAKVSTLTGGWPLGLNDGSLSETKLNRPVGLAVIQGWKNHSLVFADSGNGLVRALMTEGETLGFKAKPEMALLKAADIRAAVPPRWPFHPPEAKREIAGTFGEVRGEILPDGEAWFHNGLDIPGGYGETVRAIFTERVTRPLSVDDTGGGRERIRLPLLGYIHLRIGRDQNDQPFAANNNPGITFLRDSDGKVNRVRVRRGTTFKVGDAVGTLNRLNHVHLIAGPTAGEVNALAALQFPGITDTIPPIVEKITLLNEQWQPFVAEGTKAVRVAINGRARIIVQAYDQADGNAAYRRLGIYKLSWQLLKADGSPAEGFTQPRESLVFEKLPMLPNAAAMVYAPGSQSGYSGQTIFAYIATNVLRDGAAREDFLETSTLTNGDYLVRVIVEDFFGNKTVRDVAVTVAK